MIFRGAVALGLVLLAGCVSAPHDGAPAESKTPPDAILAAHEAGFLDDLDRRLRHVVDDGALVALQPPAHSGETVVLRLDGAGFAGNSGELELATLTPLGKIAGVLADRGACVIHVVGERVDPQDEVDSDLGERRAESVAAMLVRLGFPAARVRAESRLRSEGDGGVVIVVRPVIEQREQDAWTPPRIDS
jgi:outer membrane protein OmpA-like peptidoglycan-associated protein